MIHVDENNHRIWRDLGLAIVSDPSKQVDVSTCCTHRDQTIYWFTY